VRRYEHLEASSNFIVVMYWPSQYCGYTIAMIYSTTPRGIFHSEGWKRLLTYEGGPEKGRGSKRE
jgi:hypothetical protein